MSSLIQPLDSTQCEEVRRAIETARRREISVILNWFIAAFALALLFLVAGVLMAQTPSATLEDFWTAVLILIIVLIAPASITVARNNSYRDYYIAELMAHFIRHFNSQRNVQLSYVPLQGITELEFLGCGLFRQSTAYMSTDLVSGKIGQTEIKCAYVHSVEEEQQGNSKSKDTIFNGLFLVADFNKNFVGSTLVVPDYIEAMLGNLGHSLQKTFAGKGYGNLEIAYMENPVFERLFAVYTSDQVEARYLLTPFIIKQIVRLQQMCSGDIFIAFRHGRIYFAWSTSQQWLKPPGVLRSVTREVIEETQTRLLFALQFVDRLDLNTRIWGKS